MNINAERDLSLNGKLSIGNDASFNKNVDICGNFYAQYPDNSIPTSALSGNVNIDTESDLSLNAKLSVGKDATFNGRVDICGNFYAQYPDNSIPLSAISGAIEDGFSGFDPNNDMSLNASLSVEQNTIIGGNLEVKNDASFNNRVDICGNFYAQYPDNSIPSSAGIDGILIKIPIYP